MEKGDVHALAASLTHGDHGIGDASGEVAVLLVEDLHTAFVFFQLAGIVGFSEQILKQDGIRDADGMHVFHRPDDVAIAKYGVPGDIDVAYFYFGTFGDFERDFERRRGNAAYLRVHAGREVTVFGQQLDDHVLGALNFIGIVLRLDHQADLPILEPVQDVGDANGLVAFVFNGAHHGPLHHHETNDPAYFARLALDADIVESAAVPERYEVPVQAVRIILIASFAEDQGLQGVLANAASSPELDGFDNILRRLARADSGNRRLRSLLWLLGRLRRWLRGLGRLHWSRGHGFERIGRFRRLLRLLLILSRGLPNANAEQENSRAEHRDSQAAKPVKHHLDGFLSTLRFPSRKGAISRRLHACRERRQ